MMSIAIHAAFLNADGQANITAFGPEGRYQHGELCRDDLGLARDGIIDTLEERLMFTGSDHREHGHIHEQLMAIGAASLNGADVPRADTQLERYSVSVRVSGEGDWLDVQVIDTTPPPVKPKDMRVAWLLTGTIDTIATGGDIIAAARTIAEALNRVGYDWQNCTPKQYRANESLPIPDWASASEVAALRRLFLPSLREL